jgi:hypothetical protein
MLPSPTTTELSALAGSVCHASTNSSAPMPAVCAKSSTSSPPFCTAASMPIMVLLMAVPPAAASMPTEDSAVARASVWCSVMPTCTPAPAIRSDMSTISDSVVAMLLPSATIEEPSWSNLSWLIPVTLANLASAVAPSVAPRLVASPRSTMVRVYDSTFSVWRVRPRVIASPVWTAVRLTSPMRWPTTCMPCPALTHAPPTVLELASCRSRNLSERPSAAMNPRGSKSEAIAMRTPERPTRSPRVLRGVHAVVVVRDGVYDVGEVLRHLIDAVLDAGVECA